MVDPFSITCSAIGLASGVTQALVRISLFVSEVRSARKDMDGVSRELISLQLCLAALRDDDQQRHLQYPQDMMNHINTILVNIELAVDEIRSLLHKLSSGRMGRRIQWAITEQDAVKKIRSSLESNKMALEIALTVGTITMLAAQQSASSKQSQDMSVLIQNTADIAIVTEEIDTKLDVLPEIRKDTSKIGAIAFELISLREQLSNLTQNSGGSQLWQDFVAHSKSCAVAVAQIGPELKSAIVQIENSAASSLSQTEINFRDSAISLLPVSEDDHPSSMKTCTKCSQQRDIRDELEEQLVFQQAQMKSLEAMLQESEARLAITKASHTAELDEIKRAHDELLAKHREILRFKLWNKGEPLSTERERMRIRKKSVEWVIQGLKAADKTGQIQGDAADQCKRTSNIIKNLRDMIAERERDLKAREEAMRARNLLREMQHT